MKITGCFLIVLWIAAAPAFAADLTLFGGYQRQGKVSLNAAANSGGTITQIVKDPFGVGTFGLRFGSSGVFGHEETFEYSRHFIDTNSKAINLSSNLVLSLPTPKLKPYVTAGMGTFVVSGSGISDIGAKFAYNYGGGIKALPEGPVGVRGDIRGYKLTGVSGHKLNVFEVTLGAVFHF
jgi:hypothetical protein